LTYTYPPPPKEVLEGEDEVQVAPTTIVYHPFPSPERLAEKDVEEKLRELSFGYRAKYISETAKMLIAKLEENTDEGSSKKMARYASVDDYLHSLREMTYEQARSELLQFQGVGPKVAE
jgi:N-glycosylase/DNA lyase